MRISYKPFIILTAFLLMLSGCSVEEDRFDSYAESVTVSTMDNALRAKVEIQFREQCSYSIRYWEKEKGEESAHVTNVHEAPDGLSVLTLKFLYPETDYQMQVVVNGKAHSKVVDFTTGSLPLDIPQYPVEVNDGKTWIDGYLMQWEANNSGYVTFCDFDGRIVWYESYGKPIRTAWYDEERQQIALLMGFKEGEDNEDFYRLAEDILISDLDGNRVFFRKANDGFVPYAHHEFKITEEGNLLILSNVIKEFDLTSLGADTPTTSVWGDGFYVCDYDGNILKTWDCFVGIDPLTADYINPVKTSLDYVHANSIDIDSDGNYYMTFNRISELWKIDGKTGDVIYRAGVNGDVVLEDGEYPRGGLHAAVALAPDRILCYDNGRDKGYSRALIYSIDPVSKTARYELVIDLPFEYSSSNRSNALIINEDVMFFCSTVSAKAVFTDMKGNILRVINRSGISYRAYWIDSKPKE